MEAGGNRRYPRAAANALALRIIPMSRTQRGHKIEARQNVSRVGGPAALRGLYPSVASPWTGAFMRLHLLGCPPFRIFLTLATLATLAWADLLAADEPPG